MLTTTIPASLEAFLAVNAGMTLRASVSMRPDPSPRARVFHTFLVLGTARRRPVRAVKLRIGLAPTTDVDSVLQFDSMLAHYAQAVRILDAQLHRAHGPPAGASWPNTTTASTTRSCRRSAPPIRNSWSRSTRRRTDVLCARRGRDAPSPCGASPSTV